MSYYLFKQKTAYDLRISDWSSDVCSSDLFGDKATGKVSIFFRPSEMIAFRANANTGFRAPALQQQFFSTVTSQLNAGVLQNVGTFAAPGRASCRETVCQYVLISVVRVSLKKTTPKHAHKTHHDTNT